MILTTGGTLTATAQTRGSEIKFQDPVSLRSRVTYLDLAKKIFPAATTDETEQSLARSAGKIPVRELPGIVPETDVPTDRMEGELFIRIEGVLQARQDNEKLWWVIFSAVGEKYKKYVYQGHHILAVFRVHRREAELIDAATVKKNDYLWFGDNKLATDRISERAQLEIKPRREAVFIYTRARTNGGSPAFSLVELKGGKLNVVLSEFDLWRDHRCGYGIYETARTRLLNAPANVYRPIEIRVTTEKSREDSRYPFWRGRYRYLYVWQRRAQKYMTVVNSDKRRRAALNRYDPCNEKQ